MSSIHTLLITVRFIERLKKVKKFFDFFNQRDIILEKALFA